MRKENNVEREREREREHTYMNSVRECVNKGRERNRVRKHKMRRERACCENV